MTTETEQLNTEVAALRSRLIEVLTEQNVLTGTAVLACAQVSGGVIRDYVAESERVIAFIDVVNAVWQQIEPINGQPDEDKHRRQLEVITRLTANNNLEEQTRLGCAILGGAILTLPKRDKRLDMVRRLFSDMRKRIIKWPEG